MSARMPPGGVGRVLKLCRKLIVKHPGSTEEAIVAETLMRVLLGNEKGDQAINYARYCALRKARKP